MVDQPKRNVLILCSGNSCRSQIAEALINDRLPDSWVAYSAGIEPTGTIHPLALKVLQEVGINHGGRSKGINDLPKIEMDLVITVCDLVANHCPSWLDQGKIVQMSFPDPAVKQGSEQERLEVFRSVRDSLAEEILRYLSQY
jgi:arsenate reductase